MLAAPFNLHQLIEDTLSRSKEADPHVIAHRLVARIPDDQLRAVVAQTLVDRVREAIRLHRMNVTAAGIERKPGRSKWSAYSPFLRQRHCVAGEWKLLGNCTADDLDVLADDYQRRAAEQAALEAQFRGLAAQMRSAGAQTLADLRIGEQAA